jgi:hypothetical protein
VRLSIGPATCILPVSTTQHSRVNYSVHATGSDGWFRAQGRGSKRKCRPWSAQPRACSSGIALPTRPPLGDILQLQPAIGKRGTVRINGGRSREKDQADSYLRFMKVDTPITRQGYSVYSDRGTCTDIAVAATSSEIKLAFPPQPPQFLESPPISDIHAYVGSTRTTSVSLAFIIHDHGIRQNGCAGQCFR